MDSVTESIPTGELRSTAEGLASKAGQGISEPRPRIALLTPYTGGNLGDAAIQDAMIANIRLRVPGAEFFGICLNCDNFSAKHGVGAFPLCGTDRSFYGMSRTGVEDQSARGAWASRIKRALKAVPALGQCLKKARGWVAAAPREIRHSVAGYRFLRTQDLLIVSGGGQLDEEWGGPWGHPFTLFKWAILAQLAQIPYVIASVGACKVNSTTSRLFLSATLRMARYRSYRDKNSRKIAAALLPRATEDSIVPDLGFSLAPTEPPKTAGIRAMSRDRMVIAISPIAFAKPGTWPHQDRSLHDRYLQQMTDLVARLLERGCFLVMVCSSLGDDDRIIAELVERVNDRSREMAAHLMYIPQIGTWKDLVASLQDVDFLIASRLHSAILGFLTNTPTIAISFDPKVDGVMEDLGQTDYLLHIHDFKAEDVIDALERLEFRKSLVVEQIGLYQRRILSVFGRQYDTLTEFALAGRSRRT